MTEKQYNITMHTPIGKRSGRIYLRSENSRLAGYIEVLCRKNSIEGRLFPEGHFVFYGSLETLFKSIPFCAEGDIVTGTISFLLKGDRHRFYVSGCEVLP